MRNSLQNGINQLARAGNDKAVLGMALINLHAAMETYFRTQLADELNQLEGEQKRATWQDLINLWETSRGLPHNDRERLFQYNSLRNDIAHGRSYTISRGQVETYARFVQDFTGVRVAPDKTTPITTPPLPEHQPRASVTQNRGCSCFTRLVALILIFLLLMSGFLVTIYFLPSGLETTNGENGLKLFEDLVEDISGGADVPPTVTVDQTAVPAASPVTTKQAQPTSTNDTASPGITIRVLAQSNVRTGPSMENGAVGFAPGSAQYTVVETSPDGDWYKIELEPGVTGWIGSSRVEVVVSP